MPSTQLRVLIIDDEENICELLGYVLEAAGYSVCTAADGGEGLSNFTSWRPDLVLLDVNMPRMNGWKVLERIQEMSDTPVIMLTVLGEEVARVRGLMGGADDYVTKPFSSAELLARVEAVLRRSKAPAKALDVYEDRDIHVDFARHLVSVRGHSVELSPLEFRLFSALVRNAGVVLSPERLLDLCWNDRAAGPTNVRVYISSLRKKLEEDLTNPRLVQTVREFGYRYVAPRENG